MAMLAFFAGCRRVEAALDDIKRLWPDFVAGTTDEALSRALLTVFRNTDTLW